MRRVVWIAWLTLGWLAIGPGSAASQPGALPPPPRAVAVPLPPPVLPGEPLSEDVAQALSLGGTAAAWLTIVMVSSQPDIDGSRPLHVTLGLGAMLGPSFGHWYAGTLATRGLGLRALGLGAAYGATRYWNTRCGLDDGGCRTSPTFPALALTGVGLYVVGTLDDIITARTRARRHNQRLFSVALAPVVHADGGGLVVAGRF